MANFIVEYFEDKTHRYVAREIEAESVEDAKLQTIKGSSKGLEPIKFHKVTEKGVK
jgi:hypothetical protein